jgi:hypothetical protein
MFRTRLDDQRGLLELYGPGPTGGDERSVGAAAASRGQDRAAVEHEADRAGEGERAADWFAVDEGEVGEPVHAVVARPHVGQRGELLGRDVLGNTECGVADPKGLTYSSKLVTSFASTPSGGARGAVTRAIAVNEGSSGGIAGTKPRAPSRVESSMVDRRARLSTLLACGRSP